MCMNNTHKTAAQTNAQTTYEAHQNDIARLIDILQQEVQSHIQTTNDKPKNWGVVGELGKVRSDLIETISFISSMDRQAIESFLAE